MIQKRFSDILSQTITYALISQIFFVFVSIVMNEFNWINDWFLVWIQFLKDCQIFKNWFNYRTNRSLESNRSDEAETGTSDGDDTSIAEIMNLGDYKEIFQSRRECKPSLSYPLFSLHFVSIFFILIVKWYVFCFYQKICLTAQYAEPLPKWFHLFQMIRFL